MRKYILLSTIIVFFSSVSLGQSRKKIEKAGIKSKTEWKYEYSGSKERKIKKEVVKYDKNGNEIEIFDYNSKGELKDRVTKKYNSNNDVTIKIIYDASGKIHKKFVYEYDGKLRTSIKEYDGKGKLISKKEFIYEKY